MVLSPTRELAQQTAREARKYGRASGVSVAMLSRANVAGQGRRKGAGESAATGAGSGRATTDDAASESEGGSDGDDDEETSGSEYVRVTPWDNVVCF